LLSIWLLRVVLDLLNIQVAEQAAIDHLFPAKAQVAGLRLKRGSIWQQSRIILLL
jgi:hypothetical protein